MSTELKKRIITSLMLLALLMLMYFYSFIMIISLIIIAMICWVEFYALISKIIKKDSIKGKFFRFLYKSTSLLYFSLLIFFLIYIETYHSNLSIYILYSILVAIFSDIGGFVFGKIFKGKKLTKISPNKTISGSIGSFVLSLSLIPFFYNVLVDHNLLILSLVTILISFFSQLGDLCISFLKRKAKVKHTSNILPGHGGLLDRVDGIIFTIPMGFVLLNFI
ncbi:phosphatidate cytidylyltransferase [Candidatus Pelagibacter sp. Uisw_127]|uniref:phosphatidate cytidylyltransferase n=1 Tax=Candidatus Pelagibacter sp. Uisw_127 TaxID=3230988 RepID=UPI0039EC9B8A